MRSQASGRVVSFMLSQGPWSVSRWNARQFPKWLHIHCVFIQLMLHEELCIWHGFVFQVESRLWIGFGLKCAPISQITKNTFFDYSVFVLICWLMRLEGFFISCWVKALEGIRLKCAAPQHDYKCIFVLHFIWHAESCVWIGSVFQVESRLLKGFDLKCTSISKMTKLFVVSWIIWHAESCVWKSFAFHVEARPWKKFNFKCKSISKC